MRILREIIYFVVDYKIISFIIAFLISLVSIFFVKPESILTILKLTLSSAASVGFTLFGFTVTALSILATLKYTPFMQKVEKSNTNIFRSLTDYFVYSALFLFLYGLLGIFVSPDIFPKKVPTSMVNPLDVGLITHTFLITFIPSIALIFSINCLLLLRLTVLGNSDVDHENTEG